MSMADQISDAPPAPALGGSNRLADLADLIRAAEAARASSSLVAAERALEAGRLLLEAKAECKHGEWLPFLDRAGIAERQAQRLMTLARSGLEADTVSDLGMRAALELAAQRKLPKACEVLALSLGKGAVDVTAGGAGNLPDAIAFVWESPEAPGFFHVAGYRGMGVSGPSEIFGTERPISAERTDLVFAAVQAFLAGLPTLAETIGTEAVAVVEDIRIGALKAWIGPNAPLEHLGIDARDRLRPKLQDR